MSVKFEDNSQQFIDAMADKVKVALTEIGMQAEANAVYEITALGAVDTGNLRSSISHDDDGVDTAYVGTNVEYAPYVEMGTVHMDSRPFLKQAVQNHADEYRQMAESALKNE